LTRNTWSAFSPDGKWLAYTSTEAGNRFEIFVQSFPPSGAKYQISTDGGAWPLWSPDGTALYYSTDAGQHLVALDIRTEPTFVVGKPVALPIEAIFGGGLARNYDVTPSRQFVIVRAAGAADANQSWMQQINVVLNWDQELKQRVPTR